jgi:soluble lytic murein transglycosylase-like protein
VHKGTRAGTVHRQPRPAARQYTTEPPANSTEPSERGQALPLVLGAALVLVLSASLLVALGGAVTGAGRAQRLADLTALSAARSMRDDFDRVFAPARLESGRPNPRHLSRDEYLSRATAAGRVAAVRNGADPRRVRIEFPDGASFAPVRVRVRVLGSLELRPGGRGKPATSEVEATAEAVASPPADGAGGTPEAAAGGGYNGPLAYRQGKPMRPDVAKAFDRLAAAARRSGLALVITSAYRSDAEQAELFARNPDPRWVAPPGRSLHRCATELDLGPASAYAWLAANARRFGFLRRYSWEPWHFGYVDGPEPCSAGAGARVGADGRTAAAGGLPAYVPARFRDAIARAASRWNVSASLLAAQLLAESNFNPFAVSPAGAQGIAQFMPGTADAYGLADPFDARTAIDAQAHLMSDLLEQFGSPALALAAYNAGPGAVAACTCVPPYPETQAYVARILGLMAAGGELAIPDLEVRLVY